MGEVKTTGNISTFLALLIQKFWPVLKEIIKSRKVLEDKAISFPSHFIEGLIFLFYFFLELKAQG